MRADTQQNTEGHRDSFSPFPFAKYRKCVTGHRRGDHKGKQNAFDTDHSGRHPHRQKTLSKIQDQYDYIVIDTPPALNILTVNAYVASDSLIIPMAPEVLSLLGVSQIKETIESVRNYYNSRLQVLGILLNRFNARLNLSREMLELAQQIAAQLQTKVFQAKIRSSVSAAEAPAHGVSIMDYAPRSKPSMDFEALCQEILGESSAEEVR